MIARIRGEHDARWGRWLPTTAREAPVPARLTANVVDRQRGVSRPLHLPVLWRLVAIGVSLALVCLTVILWVSPSQARSQLPATPRAWLDAYEAAAIDNPSRACSELVGPQLAHAYGKALHGSCTSSYFKQITSFSVVVRRVLQDGGTAVLELRQTVRPRDWAVVLNRRPGGWRAVDLLPGKLVR
jgi:hypothetical protein